MVKLADRGRGSRVQAGNKGGTGILCSAVHGNESCCASFEGAADGTASGAGVLCVYTSWLEESVSTP